MHNSKLGMCLKHPMEQFIFIPGTSLAFLFSIKDPDLLLSCVFHWFDNVTLQMYGKKYAKQQKVKKTHSCPNDVLHNR